MKSNGVFLSSGVSVREGPTSGRVCRGLNKSTAMRGDSVDCTKGGFNHGNVGDWRLGRDVLTMNSIPNR